MARNWVFDPFGGDELRAITGLTSSPRTDEGFDGGEDMFAWSFFQSGDDESLVGGGASELGRDNDQGAPGGALATTAQALIDVVGADRVDPTEGVIRARLDGVADVLSTSGRVTFVAGTRGLFAVPNADGDVVLSSLEFGDDHVRANHIVGTAFSDTIAGAARISGGRGDDVLTPTRYAEGGQGDDTLIAVSNQRVELRGEAGDDTLLLYSSATVSGGAGSDRFVFGEAVQVTINDLDSGDKIDISALFGQGAPKDLFGGGYLKVTISGGYTHLWVDEDGGGDHFFELVTLKGQFPNLSDFLVL